MRSQFKERKKHGLRQYFKLIKYESRNKTEKMTREIEETKKYKVMETKEEVLVIRKVLIYNVGY